MIMSIKIIFSDPNNTFEYAKQIVENQSINLNLKINQKVNNKHIDNKQDQPSKIELSSDEKALIKQNRSSSTYNYVQNKSRLKENSLNPIIKDRTLEIPTEQSQFELGKVIKYGIFNL